MTSPAVTDRISAPAGEKYDYLTVIPISNNLFPAHLINVEIPKGEYEILHINKNASMSNYKNEILYKICYTELVYGRINKKLKIELSKDKIEDLIFAIINETDETNFQKTGKNIYVTNNERNIMLTINSYTNRIITADKLKK